MRKDEMRTEGHYATNMRDRITLNSGRNEWSVVMAGGANGSVLIIDKR